MNIVAWTGGSSWRTDATGDRAREFPLTAKETTLANKLYSDQARDFTEYWGSPPDPDTAEIFHNRANADAYATLRDARRTKRNPRTSLLSDHAAAVAPKARKNPASGIRIVHNKLLGGWYVVRGPHQTPLNGRFDSKAKAQAWLSAKRNPAKPRRDMENRIAVQFHAHGVWATVRTFPNTPAGKKAAKAYATKAIKKIPHTFRAITVNQ